MNSPDLLHHAAHQSAQEAQRQARIAYRETAAQRRKKLILARACELRSELETRKGQK